jgi:hypothetical protein
MKKFTQFAHTVVWGTRDFIEKTRDFIERNLEKLSQPSKVCESCKLLREVLERESAERKLLLDIILTRSNFVNLNSNQQLADELANLPTINRYVTLSSVRREAEEKSRERAKVAKDSEMTEAERKFQEALENTRELN